MGSTSYPPSTLAAVTSTQDAGTADYHAGLHNSHDAQVAGIVAELGSGPASTYADVTARLSALDGTVSGKLSSTTSVASTAALDAKAPATGSTAYAAPTSGGWHFVGSTGNPAFENGWGNIGFGSPELCFRKTGDDEVFIHGVVSTGLASNVTSTSVIFTLPAGYRPTNENITAAVLASAVTGDNRFAGLNVSTAGAVSVQATNGSTSHDIVSVVQGFTQFSLTMPPTTSST